MVVGDLVRIRRTLGCGANFFTTDGITRKYILVGRIKRFLGKEILVDFDGDEFACSEKELEKIKECAINRVMAPGLRQDAPRPLDIPINQYYKDHKDRAPAQPLVPPHLVRSQSLQTNLSKKELRASIRAPSALSGLNRSLS